MLMLVVQKSVVLVESKWIFSILQLSHFFLSNITSKFIMQFWLLLWEGRSTFLKIIFSLQSYYLSNSATDEQRISIIICCVSRPEPKKILQAFHTSWQASWILISRFKFGNRQSEIFRNINGSLKKIFW